MISLSSVSLTGSLGPRSEFTEKLHGFPASRLSARGPFDRRPQADRATPSAPGGGTSGGRARARLVLATMTSVRENAGRLCNFFVGRPGPEMQEP